MSGLVNRIALCPKDSAEMALQHRGFEMDAWYCDACGSIRTVLRRGVERVPTAPLDALPATAVKWVEKSADPMHGRIFNEEGG